MHAGSFTFRFGDGGASFPRLCSRYGEQQQHPDIWEAIQPPPKDGVDWLFVEPGLDPDLFASRKNLAEIAFEKKQATGVFFCAEAVLACYASARACGIILDAGHRACIASVVADGRVNNMEVSELGGAALDAWMLKESTLPSPPDNTSSSSHIIKRARTTTTTTTTTTLNLEQVRAIREVGDAFVLPDGTTIMTKCNEACLDLLCDPTPLNDPARYISLQELILMAAAKGTHAELRHKLMSNIIVCGGLSMTKDFIPRFSHELLSLARVDQPRIILSSEKDRPVASWIGGSLLASLSAFQEIKVLRSEWNEHGMEAVRRKCP